MYSYADRLRAVELYIRLGKRLNWTIRQLGLSHKECAEGLVPRVLTASRPATLPVQARLAEATLVKSSEGDSETSGISFDFAA